MPANPPHVSRTTRPRAGGPVFPGNVGDIFWGGITGPRYFMDPEQRLIGLLWMLRPSERAAVHAEFRAMVYGALRPERRPGAGSDR